MSPLLVPLIFKGMQRSFRPERAAAFSGAIEYRLHSNGKSISWVIRIEGGKAIAKPGSAAQPAVILRMSVPTFARLSAGVLDPIAAVMEGNLTAEGDLRLMNRLGEMFGGPSRI